MLRVFALFAIGSAAVWGQTQNDTAVTTKKIDRASAYYHYGMAHIYAQKAATLVGRNRAEIEANRRAYLNRAIENYKAAIEADPEMPLLAEELSDLEAGRLNRFRPRFRAF
jgi:hypothetical protein